MKINAAAAVGVECRHEAAELILGEIDVEPLEDLGARRGENCASGL
jgi:hypothetical protein